MGDRKLLYHMTQMKLREGVRCFRAHTLNHTMITITFFIHYIFPNHMDTGSIKESCLDKVIKNTAIHFLNFNDDGMANQKFVISKMNYLEKKSKCNKSLKA